MHNKAPRPISTESFRGDLRQAWRHMRRAPAFAATVVLVLACGFGVSVAIFSIVRSVLLSPLPYRDPGRLVQIVSWWPKTGDQNGWSAPLRDALDWKTTVPAFQDIAIYRYALVNLTGNGQAESVYGLHVTANLLPMLGVRPELGNWFSADRDLPGNSHALILSDEMWRRRFGADPAIVGKTIHLDNEGYQVVGVMPRGFNFPLKHGRPPALRHALRRTRTRRGDASARRCHPRNGGNHRRSHSCLAKLSRGADHRAENRVAACLAAGFEVGLRIGVRPVRLNRRA